MAFLTDQGAALPIRDAVFPAPFVSGLEYSAPARGPWNIVHIGMLLPESHQIFVCAAGCLRGVVLTAAEMGASERFSTVAIREENVQDGDMEDFLIEGVADIVRRLDPKPRAVLVFTSCVHHFTGCDLDLCFRELRQRFPGIDFTDCYMTPILRKSMTPDSLMRRQLYSLLKPVPLQENTLNIIGSNESPAESGELMQMLRAAKWQVRDICRCTSYDEYQQMAASTINLCVNPAGLLAGEALERRLGQRFLYLPLSYDYEEIRTALATAAETLSLSLPDLDALQAKAEAALAQAKAVLADTPVSIDYTATTRPLSLAKLLIEHGFLVREVYADTFTAADAPAFHWLQAAAPDLLIRATVQNKCGLLTREGLTRAEEKLLAIGQKAAYFTGTAYFVNLLEGGGYWGFDGICQLCRLMEEAAQTPKDTRAIVQVKGWGCCCA